MKDKFIEYMNQPEKMREFSQYVHENMKIIAIKMTSEMRRKLDMGDPDISNSNGYVSLQASIYGRMFNEMVYGACGYCQSFNIDPKEMINVNSLRMLLSLLDGKNPLGGLLRNDVKNDPQEFQRLYEECIDDLRKIVQALPI